MTQGYWTVSQGDALTVLSMLPGGIAQTCVTSPPYFGLRDYGNDPMVWPAVEYAPMPGLPELHVPEWRGNLGLEPTPEMFIAHLVAVFREVRRVLRDDGVAWVNMGDSYVGATSQHKGGGSQGYNSVISKKTMSGIPDTGRAERNRLLYERGLAMKNLMLIPARLALALQADGWWLRSIVIWHKSNPMPESVTDRPTKSHEYIFLLAKSERYFYDHEAVAEPAEHGANGSRFDKGKTLHGREWMAPVQQGEREDKPTRNRRDVWELSTKPFTGAHFAVFPDDIPDICIRAGTSESGQCPACGAPWERVVERTPMEIKRSDRREKMNGYGRTQTSGTMTKPPTSETTGWQPTCECDAGEPVPQLVIDPFNGAGTTGLVATRLGRRYIGIEPNPDYVAMSQQRIIDDAPMFNVPLLVAEQP